MTIDNVLFFSLFFVLQCGPSDLTAVRNLCAEQRKALYRESMVFKGTSKFIAAHKPSKFEKINLHFTIQQQVLGFVLHAKLP